MKKPKIEPRDLIEGNLVTIDNEEVWPNLKGKIFKIVDSEKVKDQYLLDNFPNSKRIVFVVDDEGREYNQLDEFIRHIPLSEDVLVKLGFKKDEINNCIYISIPEIKTEIHFEVYAAGLVCVIYSSTGSVVPNDIEYAHQTQNLFHSLTGEELKYTENKI